MLQIKSYSLLQNLKKVWNELYNNNPSLSPFVEYDYFNRAIKYFWYYFIAKRCVIKYYLITEDHSPILIAPILIYSNGQKELFGNINGYNYCDLVYKNCNQINNAIELLYDTIGRFDIYKIRENSPLVKKFSSHIYLVKNTLNVKIIFGDNYEEYYKNLSKSVRQNLRTSYNRLNKNGYKFNLKVVYGGTIDSTFFNGIINLYCKRHENRYDVKHNFIKQWLLKHCHFATENYKKSANAISFGLYINGKLAAFMSGIMSKQNEFIVPRLSINDDFSFFSPGMILITEVIKFLIENTNINCLDLSQGNEKYKYQMGGINHYTKSFIIIK